ncbi:29832_t:CDS:2, partial [Gigaspora margarita]
EGNSDTSTNTYSSDKLEVISSSSDELEAISRGSDELEAISCGSDKLEVIRISSDESEVISSSSDELEVISSQNDSLAFSNQDNAEESSPIFEPDPIFNNHNEFQLIFDNKEITNQQFPSDDSEYSNSNYNKVDSAEVDNVEFSCTAYRDFMNIATGDAILKFIKKYEQVSTKALPQLTKDGLLFLDTLKKDYSKFLSTPVVQIKDRSHEIASNCVFDYQEIYILIGQIPSENKVLALILYSDTTILDCLGKNSRHPIFISLSNIPTSLQNKAEAKALVGIMPVLQEQKKNNRNYNLDN